MTIKTPKPAQLLIAGIAMFFMVAVTSCGGSDSTSTETETVEPKPVDTTPAADTTGMDSATTRPVKAGN